MKRFTIHKEIAALFPQMPDNEIAFVSSIHHRKQSLSIHSIRALVHAYIRHTYTSYDKLLEDFHLAGLSMESAKDAARHQVREKVIAIADEWRVAA